jgi:hypothetical protein
MWLNQRLLQIAKAISEAGKIVIEVGGGDDNFT